MGQLSGSKVTSTLTYRFTQVTVFTACAWEKQFLTLAHMCKTVIVVTFVSLSVSQSVIHSKADLEFELNGIKIELNAIGLFKSLYVLFFKFCVSRKSKLNLDRANAACTGHRPSTFNHVTIFSLPIVLIFALISFRKVFPFVSL